jgi:hypothetical protein
MRVPRRLRAAVLATTAIAAIGLTAGVAVASNGVSMSYVGRAAGGGMNANGGASEISAYSPATQRLFVTNGATNKIDIWNLAKPTAPTLITSVALPSATGVQSVATNGTLVAAAATAGDNVDDKFEPGRIFIFNTSGTLDTRAPQGVEVGMLPDSVHFTPDGKTIVVANEGEPKDYCQVNGGYVPASDPKGSISIIDTTGTSLSATTIDFSAFDTQVAAIRSAGARIYGPGASVAQDMEPEYVAISADSKTAFVTLQENNAVAEINLATKSITRIMGLGYKDHSLVGNELDSSNEDSAATTNSGSATINIVNRPVFGMYEPDNIATFTGADGAQYFLTANEGDSRVYPCLIGGTDTTLGQEELDDNRLRSGAGLFGVTLGGLLTTDLVFDSQLGRTRPTRFGPSDANTMTDYSSAGGTAAFVGTTSNTAAGGSAGAQFKSVYLIGARSMSIWKVPAGAGIGSAVLVSDTGSTIERMAAERVPAYFNSDGNPTTGGFNALDSRSPAKGPEPEGIAVGKAFGMQLAFVGLERQNGVMAFDVSNPASPRFLDYLNTADYTKVSGLNYASNTNAGDVSPEGILFVRASDSPTGKPALIVSNELSGTTAIYNLNGTAVKPGAPTGVSAKADGRSAVVSWTAPKEDGGGAITSYVVTSKPGGYTCTADATASCRVDALPANRKYTFTVKTRNIAGESPASDATAEITTGSFKPKAPNGVTLRAGATSIRVMWKRSPDNGGVKIDNYIATAKPGGKTCSSTARSCVIEGLTPGKKYSVKLVAVNAVGNSAAVGTDRVLVGFVQGAKTIAQDSPVALRWLVRTHSPGKVVGSVTSGDCSIASGRLVATGTVGSTCSVKVTVGRAAGFASMTRVVDLEIRAPRDYTDLFARARTR